MSRRSLSAIVRYLQSLSHSQSGNGASDAELLERYVRLRDEAAFELLVWRHGTLVFNVCRRILPREQDAEDAFQATFLAFVRKAGSISRHGSVASWLYKVAYRVALAAKARTRRIAAREKSNEEVVAAAAAPDSLWQELRPLLDEEVNRLPERLRRPFILCYLEGKTNEEAARQLGCPAGTIFSRLARGREMLRRRLQRRGVSLSVAALTAALTEYAAEAMPAATLMTNTVRSAFLFALGQTAGGPTTQATALAEGVLRTMFVTKLRMMALMVFIAGVFAAGGVFARHALNAATPPVEDPKETRPAAALKPEVRKEKPVVSVVHPTPGGLQRTSNFVGHVRAVAQQQVYPAVSGYLKRIAVDIGDAVKKGDILAEIEAPLLEMEVKQAASAFEKAQAEEEEAKARVVTAEAEVEAAKGLRDVRIGESEVAAAERTRWQAEVKRLEKLVEKDIDRQVLAESRNQLALVKAKAKTAEGAVAAAEAEIKIKEGKLLEIKAAKNAARAATQAAHAVMEKAWVQASFTKLKATLDGIVINRNTYSGDFVFASEQGGRQPLLTVLRTDLVRVVVDVGENQARLIRPGASVRLGTNALPGVELPEYKVSRIGFAIDEKTGAMPVAIDVPNPKNLLRPGMTIIASIASAEEAPAGAVIVPESSVIKREGRSYVYIVRDGKAHLTPIQTWNWSIEHKIEVQSGVKASDRIVVDPHDLVGEVVSVEVKKGK